MRAVSVYVLAGLVVCAVCAKASQAKANTYEKKTTVIERHTTSSGRPSTAATRRTGSLTVRQMQEDLRAAGFYSGPIDGRFGPRTSQALKDFQHSKGLSVTGRMDNRTQRALMAAG
jgi:peptidoglycan hydrolase-like protein with peptidoglycan-binding domain